jgi:chromosome segregation ATPase
MTNEITIKAFAAQLDNLNLDRSATILKAASLLADMADRLTSTEQDADFYRTQANDLQNLVQEARKQIAQSAESLPAYLSDIVDMAMTQQRKNQAIKNAEKMLANDKRGTQKAKRAICEKWSKWHKENPNRYQDNTDFAEAMLQEHKDTLQSVKKITDWCGELSKEAVIFAWKKLNSNPANKTSPEDFAKLMKMQIKTLKPHVVIRWCKSVI